MRPTAFGVALIALLVVGGLVAPSSADPQIAALVWGVLVALLVVGVVWPIAAAIGQRIVVEGVPLDTSVDAVLELPLRSTRPISGAELGVGSAPWATPDPGRSSVTVRGLRRGVVAQLSLRWRTTRPLGVVRLTRRWSQPLDRPLHVAPAAIPQRWAPRWIGADAAEHPGTGLDLGGDTVRGVREYQPGDPAHLVHWPTSLRVDTLVIRELEPPAGCGAAVVVVLGGDRVVDDEVCARAMGMVDAILAAGGALRLCVHGPQGPICHAPTSRLEAGRVLAAALPGAPAAPPPGWPVEEVRP